jgi:hypothetical protein
MSLRSGIASLSARASRVARRALALGSASDGEANSSESDNSVDGGILNGGLPQDGASAVGGFVGGQSDEDSSVDDVLGEEGSASDVSNHDQGDVSDEDFEVLKGGSSVAAPTPEGSVGARARQDDSEEEWSCNVASESTSSKIPSPGCAFVSRQQEELCSCSGASEPIAFILPVFVAVGNNKKDLWAHAPINKKRWTLDGAASYYVTNDRCDLFDVRELTVYEVAFTVGNRTKIRPTHAGKTQFEILIFTEVNTCARNVLTSNYQKVD